MIKYIIFDLSEVLISGLVGIEKKLAPVLNIEEDIVLKKFGGDLLEKLLLGNITEDNYLDAIIMREGWGLGKDYLKQVIRENFHNHIDGMQEILNKLNEHYNLILLSDHAYEWVEYIHKIHSFLKYFYKLYFSYQIKSTKANKETFKLLLNDNNINAEECLFIDDSRVNIDVAASVGIKAILFKDTGQLKEALIKEGLTF